MVEIVKTRQAKTDGELILRFWGFLPNFLFIYL